MACTSPSGSAAETFRGSGGLVQWKRPTPSRQQRLGHGVAPLSASFLLSLLAVALRAGSAGATALEHNGAGGDALDASAESGSGPRRRTLVRSEEASLAAHPPMGAPAAVKEWYCAPPKIDAELCRSEPEILGRKYRYFEYLGNSPCSTDKGGRARCHCCETYIVEHVPGFEPPRDDNYWGTRGALGDRGVAGPSGRFGAPGEHGPQGQIGPPGEYNTVKGPQGLVGHKGDRGEKGAPGPPGMDAPTINATNCEWYHWDAWEDCSRTCGKGHQRRERSIKIFAEDGGEQCIGERWEEQACNVFPCTVAVGRKGADGVIEETEEKNTEKSSGSLQWLVILGLCVPFGVGGIAIGLWAWKGYLLYGGKPAPAAHDDHADEDASVPFSSAPLSTPPVQEAEVPPAAPRFQQERSMTFMSDFAEPPQ